MKWALSNSGKLRDDTFQFLNDYEMYKNAKVLIFPLNDIFTALNGTLPSWISPNLSYLSDWISVPSFHMLQLISTPWWETVHRWKKQ